MASMIPMKKRFGQHFLRDTSVVHASLAAVALDTTSSVMEIGCGDGFLTRAILARRPARLWGFEVDPDWVTYLKKTSASSRLRVIPEDILSSDMARFEPYAPWILLANLPYNITFPILYRLQQFRHLLSEGVVMMQEDVAQKIIQTSGKQYGFPSLFLQHYFSWKLLRKVPPSSFYPRPQVMSRLVYLTPIQNPKPIIHENGFWRFVQACFRQPRKTLRNNLKTHGYPISMLSERTRALRAQQLSHDELVRIWQAVVEEL